MNKEYLLVQTRCFIHDLINVLRRHRRTSTWQMCKKDFEKMSERWRNVDTIEYAVWPGPVTGGDKSGVRGQARARRGSSGYTLVGGGGGTLRGTAATEHCPVELKTNVIRRFAKVSIVCYSRPSLMIIASASQFHVYLPWGQHPFSIVS